MRNLPRVSKTALACHLVGLGIAEDGAVAESVTLYAALCSQEVGHRVLRGHPPLERHSTGAREFQPIAVRRQLAHRRCQHAMRTVEREELIQVRGKVHGLLNDLVRPQQQRRRDRQAEGFGGLEIDHRGYSKAMTAIPAATWMARSKSSTPSTMCPFVVT